MCTSIRVCAVVPTLLKFCTCSVTMCSTLTTWPSLKSTSACASQSLQRSCCFSSAIRTSLRRHFRPDPFAHPSTIGGTYREDVSTWSVLLRLDYEITSKEDKLTRVATLQILFHVKWFSSLCIDQYFIQHIAINNYWILLGCDPLDAPGGNSRSSDTNKRTPSSNSDNYDFQRQHD